MYLDDGERWAPPSEAALGEAVRLMGADELDLRWVQSLLSVPLSAKMRVGLEDVLRAGRENAAIDMSDKDGAAAIFHLSPIIVERLRGKGVSAPAVADTVGDIGRHLRRHRRVTGRPGLPNWRWFGVHVTGTLVEVGRLQFEVIRCDGELTEVAGAWAARIHIPADSGPLLQQAVEDSLVRGARELRRAWPGIELTYAACDSWLLDPYLSEHLPNSNIAAFAGRFTPYAPPSDEPTDPLYFLWGHRDLERLPSHNLSSLERVVVERIARGGVWQFGRGVLRFPSV
jgi:hypothetical protein